MNIKKRHWSSSQVIILGFIGLIMSGAVLLCLPISSASGQWTPFLDALFTSTSASCVTGLVVRDTATYWSAFGQTVILCLIQTGGMGVVTMAAAIAIVSGRKISLSRRQTMQDSISAQHVGGIVRMTGFIIKTSICIELLGALALSFVFVPEFGLFKGIWYSVFHGISAFCNAGFDLMGTKSLFSSLTDYTGNGIVNIAIMLLIVVGGIGFSVWADVKNYKLKFRKYRMQSKVAIAMTILLIAVPFMYFYIFEFSRPEWNMLTTGEKLWAALFRAVTPRTAGFNTVDTAALSEPSIFITIILMLIGGCPGSTAGGMKTTTVAVLLATMVTVFTRRGSTGFFKRRVDDETINKAATVLMMYITLFIFGSVVISIAEGLPLLDCMFETASAVGTVGLSVGITSALGSLSKIILILLMYMGRVGGLTIIFATVKGVHNGMARYPHENITVG